jgi:tetratricopeptide (TPR) repeat protein
LVILFLKHIGVRLWSAVLIGGLVCLWMLPVIQQRIGRDWSLQAVGTILIAVFLAVGWALNRHGLSTVARLMRAAGAFERDGMVREAETAFRQAAAVFDSFLVSPWLKRKKSNALAARMARFYLARAQRDHASEALIVAYLQSNPQDEEVAVNWLQQLENRGGLREDYQDLVARIGSALPNNHQIQATLARFFLLMERTDFMAMQAYRRVYEEDTVRSAGFIAELARLFLKEKRADEWALEVYLEALKHHDDPRKYAGGLAACLHWIPPTERSQHLLQVAEDYLSGIDADDLKEMSAGFKPRQAVDASTRSAVRRQARPGFNPATILVTAVKAIVTLPGRGLRWVLAGSKSLVRLGWRSKIARRVSFATVLALLTLGMGGLVINTVRYLGVGEKPESQRAEPAAAVVTEAFTLQVAAYLQPEYAKKLVEDLQRQGQDAYWMEAVRGEKRWYQVRVFHFATKQSARDYGEKLKSQGIIDDYYVTNYRRP